MTMARARRSLERRGVGIESKLAALGKELADIDALLATPGFYGDGLGDAVTQARKKRTRLAQDIEKMESEWLQLQGKIDSMETPG